MIRNAKDRVLDDLPWLPDVTPAIDLLLQPLAVGIVQSSQVGGATQEVVLWKKAKAVRQPFTAQQLAIKPEGERAWAWYTIHLAPDLGLKPDDLILIHGLRLRVMEKLDYREYGYVQLHAIADYHPTVTL